LCIDFQALYPPALVPGFLREFLEWYLRTSNDPFMGGMFGRGKDPVIWFRSFIFIEAYAPPHPSVFFAYIYTGRFFQFPTFFIAARGLWNGAFPHFLGQ
jgi:hypothetical protein